MSSGLLDIERRVEDAALELLNSFVDLTGITGFKRVIRRRDARYAAGYPCLWIECYNMAEYGLHTGCYLGGLRFGSISHAQDDLSRDIAKQIMGAVRMFCQQEDLETQFNNTAAAQAVGGLLTMIHVANENAPYYNEVAGMPMHEMIYELTIVARPSR